MYGIKLHTTYSYHLVLLQSHWVFSTTESYKDRRELLKSLPLSLQASVETRDENLGTLVK